MAFKYAVVMLVAILVLHEVVARSTLRVVRSPKDVLEEKPRPEDLPCEVDVPCGWAVYLRYTKEVDYYIYNCLCKDTELCTKYRDDYSAKAFVYKCMLDNTAANSTTTTNATPTTQ